MIISNVIAVYTMAIPAFDGILDVLPPYVGDPCFSANHSPYQCTMLELCQRFASSPARKTILSGFLSFRAELRRMGITGFQWLDGSFSENIEAHARRDPDDIDVITFAPEPSGGVDFDAIVCANAWILDNGYTKSKYFVDHFLFPLSASKRELVHGIAFWCGFFSHRRDDTRKGMLVVDLNSPSDDANALNFLGSLP